MRARHQHTLSLVPPMLRGMLKARERVAAANVSIAVPERIRGGVPSGLKRRGAGQAASTERAEQRSKAGPSGPSASRVAPSLPSGRRVSGSSRVVDAQRPGSALPTQAAEARGIVMARAGTGAAGIARVKRIGIAAIVVVSLLSTSVVHARERRWSLFGGGLALFLAGWALDVGLTYGLGHEPATTSLIPVVGPLVQMGDSWAMIAPARTGNAQVDLVAQQRIDDANRTIQQVAYAVLALDCAMQLAGSTMLVVGIVGRDEHRADRVSVSVAPMSNGMRVRVRF